MKVIDLGRKSFYDRAIALPCNIQEQTENRCSSVEFSVPGEEVMENAGVGHRSHEERSIP